MIGDREGLPLLVVTTPANVPDQVPFVAMLDAKPSGIEHEADRNEALAALTQLGERYEARARRSPTR